MNGRIITCSPDKLNTMVAFLDEAFVARKGRTTSLADRYPDVFAEGNLDWLLVAEFWGKIVSAVVAKPFSWIVNGREWRGAMVGFVLTHPDFRGRGLATHLLHDLKAALVQRNFDVAVLWTTIPAFYERLGWTLDDESLYGTVRFGDSEEPMQRGGLTPITSERIAFIERVRSHWGNERIGRSELSYRRIPLPATSIDLLVTEREGSEAYALVGRRRTEGYLYEWMGSQKSLEHLWGSMSKSYRHVFVNEREGTPTSQWLTNTQNADLRTQNHAMWLWLSSAADRQLPRFIPYLDRI